MGLNVIGISAFYHDSACCLLTDGHLIAAAQEERFSRIKHDAGIPKKAFKYCLEQAGLQITDIDCIAYYEVPEKKYERQKASGILLTNEQALRIDPHTPMREIREVLGFEGQIKFVEHHHSHAASSFYFSGFDEASILTIDGVGEWATTTYGFGKGKGIDLFEEVRFPNSLGLLYSAITNYLGFSVNGDEYKVMGLAPYGKPSLINKIKELIEVHENGQYVLNMTYFNFLEGKRMYSEKLCSLLGQPARKPDSHIEEFHMNLAKSIQNVLEEVLLSKVTYLHNQRPSSNLCLAGGVALNCVANGYILKNGPFKKMFVQPAANDSGGAIGAAAVAHLELTEEGSSIEPLKHVYLGPEYTNFEISNLLESTSLNFSKYENQSDLISQTAKLLAKGKVIGWFQGRMEFGPRALGSRSILADPRIETMRDKINTMVKKREGFRPFAPAILEDKAQEYFDINHSSPFMLETCQVISDVPLPAITHVDGSARVQTVSKQTNAVFHSLLTEFYELTECPILLNTSFNVKGEPIVCTPLDALKCFITTEIDCLVLGNFIIERENNSLFRLELKLNNQFKKQQERINEVYSFI